MGNGEQMTSMFVTEFTHDRLFLFNNTFVLLCNKFRYKLPYILVNNGKGDDRLFLYYSPHSVLTNECIT